MEGVPFDADDSDGEPLGSFEPEYGLAGKAQAILRALRRANAE